MAGPTGNAKARHELMVPVPLMDRARRAAWWHGYQGEREFSAFICMVLDDWISEQASKRSDKDYPAIPPV